MDSFQITVLVVVAVLLIIIFVAIGLLTNYGKVDKVYPPSASTCPDYWTADTTGKCRLPMSQSSKNRGTIYTSGDSAETKLSGNVTSSDYTPGYDSQNSIINFSDAAWSSLGKTSICAKKDWVNKYKISWDGVSNYNSCD